MPQGFMLKKEKGVEYFEIPAFAQTELVAHGFSTVKGGISEGCYSGLNLAFHTGDVPEAVLNNRAIFSQALGIESAHLVCGEQVHGEQIVKVTKEDLGKGAFEPKKSIKATDALITAEKNVPLITFYADCVPIFFLDPIKKVIGLAHAGWKGTVAKIGAKTVKQMQLEFNCQAENILVGIGPSIGPCHYEVDLPVMVKFQEAFPNYWEKLLSFSGNEKAQLNLWEANAYQLREIGILNENITIAKNCTVCQTEYFYSYRAQGKTGRMAAIIMLK